MRRRPELASRPVAGVLAAMALLFCVAWPALAQDSPKSEPPSASESPSAHQDPPKSEPPPAHHPRMTMEQHFTQANLAHDGHLTLEEAKAGYPTVARHFRDIDVDTKGYVTQNDVRAWHALRKAAHRPRREATDRLRPQGAFWLSYPSHQLINTSTNRTVRVPTDTPSAHSVTVDAAPEPAASAAEQ